MNRKHDRSVYKRWFNIWRITGELPFRKHEDLAPIECPSCGETISTPYCPYCGEKYGKRKKKTVSNAFFKGSFDSIPFLNDDAKRTFVHILLRPGYMIRDYINGQTSRYLAPMTALIIFYAFFALLAGIITPLASKDESRTSLENVIETLTEAETQVDSMDFSGTNISINGKDYTKKSVSAAKTTVDLYALLHLDEHPEQADTNWKKSLAAAEASLKNGGISLFLGNLILLTFAIWFVFRKKYGMSLSASAATAAYILCQYCFFMLFILLWTLGEKSSIGLVVMALLMIFDFSQLFGVDRRKGLRLAIRVGLAICLEYFILFTVLVTILGIKIIA